MQRPISDPRYVDLHLHTTWSDGRWGPRRVVDEAAERGLAAIAITDHDVLDGLAEAAEAADARGIELVTGVELTADWGGRTAHLLGYGIDPANPSLRAALERGREQMRGHVDHVLSEIGRAGERLVADDLRKYRARYAAGASLVMAMVERGVLKRVSNGAALLRLAAREPRAYTFGEAIELIHAAGGIASLAHPVRLRRDRPRLDAAELLPFVDAGLDGIEAWQIVHGAAEREHYQRLAGDLGLIATGGSDCHGPRRQFGPRIGSQRVPYAVYAALMRAVAARRSSARAETA